MNYYYSVYIKYLNMNKQEAINNTQGVTIPSEHEYTRGNNTEWKLHSW